MDIQFFGGNCVVVSHKGTRLVIDDNLADLGAKSVTKEGDIVLFTGLHTPPKANAKLVVDRPGEYEVADVSIVGTAARAHLDEATGHSSTIYKIVIDGISVMVAGHIYPELSEDQLERIGMVDVLLVPVGGNGYTLDPVGALQLVRAIEPKIVIPTHYDNTGLNYPVPQQTLADGIKGLGMEVRDTLAKFKLKPSELTDTTQLIVLERS